MPDDVVHLSGDRLALVFDGSISERRACNRELARKGLLAEQQHTGNHPKSAPVLQMTQNALSSVLLTTSYPIEMAMKPATATTDVQRRPLEAIHVHATTPRNIAAWSSRRITNQPVASKVTTT
ncbi:MAG: hypothetical protein ABIW84_03970, partial [Ilumatobacteraceae bacterium]